MIVAGKEIKVVGTMALCGHPMWRECLESLQSHVDELYLHFDGRVGNDNIFKNLNIENFPKLKNVIVTKKEWNRYNWRERMLRVLDDVKPDVVLNMDEDEMYDGNIEKDIEDLLKSPENIQMFFQYVYPIPGTKDQKYPKYPHVKMFRWIEGLTFYPYRGSARLSNAKGYCNSQNTKILHYCWYNAKCRKYRDKRYDKRHE